MNQVENSVRIAYEKHMARGVRYCAFMTVPPGYERAEEWVNAESISPLWSRGEPFQWGPDDH